MLHALTWSLIEHLRNQVPEANDVVWVYDGVSLTGRTKPFLTVEQMTGNSESIAAGRLDYEDIFRFQVGLRSRNIGERSRLTDVVKDVLRQPNIPLYDTRIFPPTEEGVFVCDVKRVVPIQAETTEDETNRHRVYFDVEVTVYRRNADGLNFNQ